MNRDWIVGDRSGLELRAFPDGLYVSGWYDSFVGIEGAFITWEELDKIRKKARRRMPFNASGVAR